MMSRNVVRVARGLEVSGGARGWIVAASAVVDRRYKAAKINRRR
jgi:hypothetical protein